MFVVIGGGLVGTETAELLAEMGCYVSIVEMMEEIAKEESSTVKPTMLETFKKHHVEMLTKIKVMKITPSRIETEGDNGMISLPCDYVVLAVCAKPNVFDITPLTSVGIEVHLVGDCHDRVSDIYHAIEEGYLVANTL